MNKDTPLFAAIPFSLIDAAGDGDITPSMLAVMVFLYRWADWETGMVKRTSARAIAQFCQGKWAERTIQEDMKRLELQGYIWRKNRPGSHKWYPVLICNYVAKVRRTVLGPDGKPERDERGRVVTAVSMELINPRQPLAWDDICGGRVRGYCADSSGEPSEEPSDEASDEASDNTTYINQVSNRGPQGKKGSQTDDDGRSVVAAASPQDPGDHETGEPVVPAQPAQPGTNSTCPVAPQAPPPSPAEPRAAR